MGTDWRELRREPHVADQPLKLWLRDDAGEPGEAGGEQARGLGKIVPGLTSGDLGHRLRHPDKDIVLFVLFH